MANEQQAPNQPAANEEPAGVQAPPVQSPPPAPAPERVEPDTQVRLRELAAAVTRSGDRRLLAEYLRARRAVR